MKTTKRTNDHRLAGLCRIGGGGLLTVMALVLGGCNFISWGAGIFEPVGGKTVIVPAQYTQLNDKRVAILVSADDYTLFRFTRSTYNVGHIVSQQITTTYPPPPYQWLIKFMNIKRVIPTGPRNVQAT